MPFRGEVYYPDANLPPGQDIKHSCVVLSPTNLLSSQGNKVFVNVAIIRSAFGRGGQPAKLVPGHSIKVTPAEASFLTNDSYVETHQIFAVPLMQLHAKRPVGRLAQPVMDRVLAGARQLFT
ncbi:MAG: type II toxin-antitoxin system PemK/MazF family toxin [Myxococcaceae bacterium]